MIKPEVVKPPLIPIYPMVSKDLSVIHICNKTKLEGLINFEKMRFVAKVNIAKTACYKDVVCQEITAWILHNLIL